MIDRKKLELAAGLMAKAQRTDFDGEAIACIEKSYALLAQVITAYDDAVASSAPGTRRRERRLLRDRRATRRLGFFGESARKANPAAAYRQLDGGPQQADASRFDLEA